MTSSSAFISLSNNSHTSSPLPSPPLSHQYNYITYFDKKMPTLTVDRALSTYTNYNSTVGGGDRSGLHSDTRYTTNNNNNRRRDVAELRPFLFKPVSDNNNNNKYQLPPIQNVMMTTPTASPSPLFDSYYSMQSSSPISSIASSPTPVDEDEDNEDQQQKHRQLINIRRKGSIASLLNSDPELRQLDEEESKCNYQSHFIDNYSSSYQTSLKRGRPRQDHIETVYNQYQHPIIKKQRILNNNVRDNSISHDFDCVQQQACQSSSLVTSNTTNLLPNSITNESPRAAKGLRHFSKQVCDKVAEKGVTTYNEVADELALDIQNSVGNEKHSYDQKNIRRRVYDALNVLMAMNIIAKDKKVIKWLGIPECYKQNMNNNSKKVVVIEQEDLTQMLLKQIEQEEQRQSELMNSLNNLRQTISQKLSKHLQIRNLVQRNQQFNSKQNNQDNNRSSRISLPFFIVACPIANDNNNQIDMVNYSHSAVITFRHTTEHVVYQDSDILQHLNFD